MAARVSHGSEKWLEDSSGDLAAKVREADEAIERARAEQQAASDRLAREVRRSQAALTQEHCVTDNLQCSMKTQHQLGSCTAMRTCEMCPTYLDIRW
jgi:hypothetical protein